MDQGVRALRRSQAIDLWFVCWHGEFVLSPRTSQLLPRVVCAQVQMEKFNEELAASLVSVNEQCKQREAQLKQIKS